MIFIYANIIEDHISNFSKKNIELHKNSLKVEQ